MRKGVIAGFWLAACLILVSTVYAHFPGNDNGICPSVLAQADPDAVKKFQRETLPLRDELMAKKIELRKEFGKTKPDKERIAALRKEMGDIRTKILQKADETGVSKSKDWGTCSGRMLGKGIM